MQPHPPWRTKRQPLGFCCSQTGRKTASMPVTTHALTRRMFVLFLETSQWKECATCHSSTSKSKHHPCQKQLGMHILVVWNKVARTEAPDYKNTHGMKKEMRLIILGNQESWKCRQHTRSQTANWKDIAKDGLKAKILPRMDNEQKTNKVDLSKLELEPKQFNIITTTILKAQASTIEKQGRTSRNC